MHRAGGVMEGVAVVVWRRVGLSFFGNGWDPITLGFDIYLIMIIIVIMIEMMMTGIMWIGVRR